MEIREIYKKDTKTMPALEKEELIKKKRKEDDKTVNGMFEFIDAMGGFLEFTHRIYPGESIKMIKLYHGEVCDLPMGIVRHLNNTKKKVRRYSMELAPNGQKVPRSYETISRVRFTPMSVL